MACRWGGWLLEGFNKAFRRFLELKNLLGPRITQYNQEVMSQYKHSLCLRSSGEAGDKDHSRQVILYQSPAFLLRICVGRV